MGSLEGHCACGTRCARGLARVNQPRLQRLDLFDQAHTRTRYPDNCRQLKFPSILVPCQEEATREPCLQPLRLLPIQLPTPMSLLQLHAAIISILIATLDSIECILEVVSFSELSVFLELLFVNVLQELPQDL